MANEFVHLHVHSEYSILDGVIRLSDLVNRTVEYGMPAVALTDHGAMYGAIEFMGLCRSAGIKPIVGCEVYITDDIHSREEKDKSNSYHFVLLCRNDAGYHNLVKLVSRSYIEGFHYKPRIDKTLLAEHSEGLIGLTACLKGEVPTRLLMNKRPEALRAASEYRDILGRENFFIELQDHGIAEERRVMPSLIKLAESIGVGVVATNDVHYLDRDDSKYQDVMLCIQTGKKLNDPDRLSMEGMDLYFKSNIEMERLFPDIPEALTNSLVIAERVEMLPEFEGFDFPNFPLPEGQTAEETLSTQAWAGLKTRFGGKEIAPEYEERLGYELSVIVSMDFAPIFLIVADYVNHAKESGIAVGPGRGSAVSGLVSWALGITEVDPIKYNLLFERFLNPARKSLPDIDIDFCPRRRTEMLKYIQDKYGSEHICQIITFNRLKARAAIRDTARVMDIPLSEADRVAKLVPFNADLRTAMEMVPELGSEFDTNPHTREWIETAMAVEGLARNVGVHPAGIVVSGSPVYERAPLQTMESTDQLVAQYSMECIEKIGLIKVDLLGLRTLTYIEDTCKLVAQRKGITIDVNNLPLDDKKTFTMLSKGDTLGVFQLEGGGMKELLIDIHPDRIDDIIACIALYRPGPMGSGLHTKYARRKNLQEPIEYLNPLQEPVLSPTYGVLTYQEQVGQLLQNIAGFDLSEAMIVMKAISKKRSRAEIQKYEDDFIAGALAKDVPDNVAHIIFNQIEEFAGYGFNKAHSAAYGIVAYQTAYLKANYPLEFYCAFLSSEMHDSDKMSQIIGEMQSKKIPVITPDINTSNVYFTIEDDKVRFALGAIKNVGVAAVDFIVKAREEGGPFNSLFDFTARVDSSGVNKGVVESLVLAGAMDSLPGSRSEKYATVDLALEYGRRRQDDARRGQTDLFLSGGDNAAGPDLRRDSVEIPKKLLLKREKELIGTYLSENPLKDAAGRLNKMVKMHVADINEKLDGKKIKLGGMISSISRRISKKLQSYAIIELEDLTGKIEGIVFPNTYEEYRDELIEDAIVIVDARVQVDEKEVPGPTGDMIPQYATRLLVGEVQPFDKSASVESQAGDAQTEASLSSTIVMKDESPKRTQTMAFRPRKGEVLIELDVDEAGKDGLNRMIDFLHKNPGTSQVRLLLRHGEARGAVELGKDLMVNLSNQAVTELNGYEGVRDIRRG